MARGKEIKGIRTPCFRSKFLVEILGHDFLHFGPTAENASHHSAKKIMQIRDFTSKFAAKCLFASVWDCIQSRECGECMPVDRT